VIVDRVRAVAETIVSSQLRWMPVRLICENLHALAGDELPDFVRLRGDPAPALALDRPLQGEVAGPGVVVDQGRRLIGGFGGGFTAGGIHTAYCNEVGCDPTNRAHRRKGRDMAAKETATLAGGCFWCLEAVFDDIKGVDSVESGYMGGRTPNPTYEQVCSGETGHAEVVRLIFDPELVSFREILEVFFVIHDPTTLNRQGNDIGTQYRSAIFYHSPLQKSVAEEFVANLSSAKVYDSPIVTEIAEASQFYVAENYHQEYFRRNPAQPYCAYVVRPKVAKFRKQFLEKLKS
jgi:peptide-methionine (S)-S-oxide reductase